jgi:hypothetical protein
MSSKSAAASQPDGSATSFLFACSLMVTGNAFRTYSSSP